MEHSIWKDKNGREIKAGDLLKVVREWGAVKYYIVTESSYLADLPINLTPGLHPLEAAMANWDDNYVLEVIGEADNFNQMNGLPTAWNELMTSKSI